KRISEIVKLLVVYSRAGASAARTPESTFSLAEAVDEAVGLVRLDPRGQEHPIDNRCANDVMVFGDRTRLLQVFINLLQNACDASPAGERIEVRGRADANTTVVEIVDKGAGIPDELRARIFEPFFTTKEA